MSEIKVQDWKNRWNVKGKIQATRELQKDKYPNSDCELPKSLADSLIMHHGCLRWPGGEGGHQKPNRDQRRIDSCKIDPHRALPMSLLPFFFFFNWTESWSLTDLKCTLQTWSVRGQSTRPDEQLEIPCLEARKPQQGWAHLCPSLADYQIM